MNDRELSTLLQEWPPTAAPVTLEERVFGLRPVPVAWWGRVPAGPLAALGTVAGALLVSLLFLLVQREPADPSPPALVKQVVAPELPAPKPQPATAPKRAPKARPAVKPSPVPPPLTSNLVSTPPTVLYNPMPVPPPDAGPTVLVATVGLRVHIDKEGRVTGAEFLEGNAQLADIAIEAVMQWRYKPEFVNGEPVESSTTVAVYFGPRPRPAKAVAR